MHKCSLCGRARPAGMYLHGFSEWDHYSMWMCVECSAAQVDGGRVAREGHSACQVCVEGSTEEFKDAARAFRPGDSTADPRYLYNHVVKVVEDFEKLHLA